MNASQLTAEQVLAFVAKHNAVLEHRVCNPSQASLPWHIKVSGLQPSAGSTPQHAIGRLVKRNQSLAEKIEAEEKLQESRR